MADMYIGSRRMPKWPCPECWRILDALTGASENPDNLIPTATSLTVCMYCGVLLEFGRDGFTCAAGDQLLLIDREQRDMIEATIRKPIRIAG